jgi:YD repeat-containing protein
MWPFDYDAAGNRLWMTDGLGRVDYQYTRLSRMSWEKRTLNDFPSTPFTLSYDYNLVGELKSITDPFNATISYVYDSAGRLNSVNGTGFGSVTQLASDMKYRAWGALKSLSYNSSRSLNLSYNVRLQMNRQEIVGQSGTSGAEYEYYANGFLRYSHDLSNSTFDRLYSYDLMGRITEGLSGSEANSINTADGPYNHTYSYDVWGNLTGRTGRHWSHNVPSVTATYSSYNNRNLDPSWQYDAEGNITRQGTEYHDFDATGRQTRVCVASSQMTYSYDGDGLRVKRTNPGWVGYEIRSSMMNGRIVLELNQQGQIWQRHIYANGVLLADQIQDGQITWKHRSPNGISEWNSFGTGVFRSGEYDPLGTAVGIEDPYINNGGGDDSGGWTGGVGMPSDFSGGCALDYNPISCDWVAKFYNRDRQNFLIQIINTRFGSFSPIYKTDQKFDASSTIVGSGSRQDPTTGNYTAYVSVVGGPGVFDTSTVGFTMNWVNLRPIQNVLEFKMGNRGVPFTDGEKDLLNAAFKYVNSKKCRDFVNKILEPIAEYFDQSGLKGSPPPGRLDELLKIASFNKYSSKLTAEQMGISQARRNEIANNYEKSWTTTFNGVTNGTNVWLSNEAFITLSSSFSSRRDLPAIIVHELLHVAGLTDPYVEGLNTKIQQNCGWGGLVGD